MPSWRNVWQKDQSFWTTSDIARLPNAVSDDETLTTKYTKYTKKSRLPRQAGHLFDVSFTASFSGSLFSCISWSEFRNQNRSPHNAFVFHFRMIAEVDKQAELEACGFEVVVH